MKKERRVFSPEDRLAIVQEPSFLTLQSIYSVPPLLSSARRRPGSIIDSKRNIMDLQNMKVAEVQLTYKTKVKAIDRPKINTSEEAHRIIQANWNYEIIQFIE